MSFYSVPLIFWIASPWGALVAAVFVVMAMYFADRTDILPDHYHQQQQANEGKKDDPELATGDEGSKTGGAGTGLALTVINRA